MACLREKLAALAHEQWSGWMRYMLGRLEGPESQVWIERWRRQMGLPYSELREDEKESDRREADRVLSVLRGGTEGGHSGGPLDDDEPIGVEFGGAYHWMTLERAYALRADLNAAIDVVIKLRGGRG